MNLRCDEDSLQVYTADVMRLYGVPGVVFFHVPNGGKRHIATAKRLKAMGTLPGVADWVFVLPGGKVAFLELKATRGRQSDDQKDFQRAVEALGCWYALARTPAEIDGVLLAFGAMINKSVPQRPLRGEAAGKGGTGESGSPHSSAQFTEDRGVGA